jgi:hypothetical protein
MQNFAVEGLSAPQLEHLIGAPERANQSSFFYN